MKLISLYIENFGGLSRYSLDFQEGLTVVQQPNGFGKTTLAEFIRAMFYGFPRRAKTLDKSRRQKFTPWQGGKFGGNLVFEYRGSRYRIERTFGATPKGDSFTLIDLSTGKKSDRFSEEIGLELFQLDADSFERSTYMPQLQGLTSLTTDSIQAKLGNLVEDAGDMGNYENAVAALKAARSAFIPYRGSGGSVAQAQAEITRLQNQAEQTELLKAGITARRDRVAELENRLEALTKQQRDHRARILAASESAAVNAAHREYRQLSGRKADLEAKLQSLNDRYPNGLPSDERLSAARQAVSELELLSAAGTTSQEDLDAEAFVEKNRSRFENHLPSREELDHCREQISRRDTLIAQARSIGLSEAETELYEKLLPMAESGCFEKERLDKLDTASRELSRTEHALQTVTILEEDRTGLDDLKAYFAPGIPTEEELREKRQGLVQAEDLRREKADLLEDLAAVHPEKPGFPVILLTALSLAGIANGIWMLNRQPLFSLLCFALGGCALAGLVFLSLRLAGKSKISKLRREELGQKISDLDTKIAGLEEDAAAFAARYTTAMPVAEALMEIRANRETFQKLATRIAETTAKRQRLSGQAQVLREMLARELGSGDFDRMILDLRLAAGQFRDLQEEIAAAEIKIRQLHSESASVCAEITNFLGAYYPSPEAGMFHALLSDLQRSSEAYATAQNRLVTRIKLEAQHQQEQRHWEEVLNAFFREFCIPRHENLREQLLKIRDDVRDFRDLTCLYQQAAEEVESYLAANRTILEKAVSEIAEDIDALRSEENDLNRQIRDVTALLLEEKQRLSQNTEQYSQLPALRDELELWQEKKDRDQNRAALIKDTLVFLEQAREKLQSSYLGPLRSSFAGYMARLLGEDSSKILLTSDLDVRLERHGQSRELGYFSAGQTDTVMLCMRLALVDALFTDTKPFVILDDPFVNLDDAHTAQALSLLQELARERQILYLVCNSSRIPQ